MNDRAALVCSALRACPLFVGLSEERLAETATVMTPRRYARHATIFQQGDPGADLFLVTGGVVKIVQYSREGEEAIIGEVHPGETFGELVLIDGAARSATAVAATDCETLRLPRRVFVHLLESDPVFRQGVLAALARELRRATYNLAELHFLTMPRLLASRLASLAKASAPGATKNVPLSRPYSQTELGQMVGVTRQSVNRALSELEAEGLLRVRRTHIEVLDVGALEARGEW
jgi:CRP/FNR family cyclic AMP-dependent transcriptional regulator